MDNYLDILRREFAADDGSFLLRLRCDLVWDQEAFSRVTEAMLRCCQDYDLSNLSNTGPTLWGDVYDRSQLPRWLVEGFWYMADFVKGHSSHPDFRRPYPQKYYEAAYQRLWDLAYWFFTGCSPYLPGYVWEPL